MKKLSNTNAVYPDSEAVKIMNYDFDKQILEIGFTNNRTYQYLRVPQKKWKNLLEIMRSGNSVGEFVNTKIKPFYNYVEVT